MASDSWFASLARRVRFSLPRWVRRSAGWFWTRPAARPFWRRRRKERLTCYTFGNPICSARNSRNAPARCVADPCWSSVTLEELEEDPQCLLQWESLPPEFWHIRPDENPK